MSHVAIVTDSTASIPEPMLEELEIHTVAYYIHRGQEVLRDLVTIQRDEFLRWLMTTPSLPTTASPGPGDYVEPIPDLDPARPPKHPLHPYDRQWKRRLPGRDHCPR